VYECLAYNLELNIQVSKRINLHAEPKLNKEQTDLDISEYISIDVLSDKKGFRKNGNLTLQCVAGWLFSLGIKFFFFLKNLFSMI
jgi:hypothetical protein